MKAGTLIMSFTSLMACESLLAQVVIEAIAVGAPLPLDAARGAMENPENQRNPFSPRAIGGRPPLNMQIQGDGIRLPQGVGGANPAAPGKEKERDSESEKQRALTDIGCIGPNRDGQGCTEKEADSVARKIDQRTERSPGVAPPSDTKVQGGGVATPRCFAESRESVDCGN
jgi:hypothetical protein